jgi:hypothetical protein
MWERAAATGSMVPSSWDDCSSADADLDHTGHGAGDQHRGLLGST